MASGLTPAFPGRQMPESVTRPNSQVLHPIYLSLLPMTRHAEMDTEAAAHIDSGSLNSQAEERLIYSQQLPFPRRERKRGGGRLSGRQRVQTEVYMLLSPAHPQQEDNIW
ncbi:hypothetical protein PBY51_002379 [Eleginops maclovinus]|nr:hypothetical protein PBY51_002379 [Eleginops maclovinus]